MTIPVLPIGPRFNFTTQFLAHRWIAQCFQKCLRALRIVSGMDERPEPESVADIRIDIRRHIHSPGARLPDQIDGLLHERPILLAGGLQMVNVHRYVGAAANLQSLADGLQHFRAFISHVGGVESAVLRNHFPHLDQLVGSGVSPRRVDQRRGKTDRAVPHRLRDQFLHARHLGGRGRAVHVADDNTANLRRANVVHHV